MDRKLTQQLIEAVADRIVAAEVELTVLDQAIGDGDHGINMKRGTGAVRAAAAELAAKPVGEAVKAVGMQLVMKVGGASGPLYGTLLMTLGKLWPDPLDRAGLATAVASALEAVKARGKSEPGQKTMLDVLFPVSEALAAGKSPAAIKAVAAEAAEATVPLQAVRGRASFLGERSAGHMDPGARSSQLAVEAVCDVLEAAQ
ncbi:MAG: dihydroxyacetone kinase subunit L [Rhodospirillales bacterium]|nr:dihydroxyacetone kinase subunit L [Rhodospirillales bacterium]